jgi:hypothetical protein
MQMRIYLKYSSSPTLIEYNSQLQSALTVVTDADVTQFAADWLSIATATSAGLDNWGLILGQNRTVADGTQFSYNFGFNNPPIEPTNSPQNFNNGVFDSGTNSGYITLGDIAYRALLQLLYSKYATDNSLASLNAIIQNYATQTTALYPTRNKSSAYVQEGVMSINYNFLTSFALQNYELNLFRTTNVLAKPSGVKLNLTYEEVL